MPHYKIEGINLLKMKGARLVSAEVDGHAENCVLIPVRYNDIFVGVGREDKPNCARLSLMAWEASPSFIASCRASHADNTDYIAPTHSIEMRYSQKFEEKARASAYNRLKADPVNADKTEEELQKLTNDAMREAKRISGTMIPIPQKEQPAYSGMAPSVSVGAATVPAVDANGQAMPDSFDDLPF